MVLAIWSCSDIVAKDDSFTMILLVMIASLAGGGNDSFTYYNSLYDEYESAHAYGLPYASLSVFRMRRFQSSVCVVFGLPYASLSSFVSVA